LLSHNKKKNIWASSIYNIFKLTSLTLTSKVRDTEMWFLYLMLCYDLIYICGTGDSDQKRSDVEFFLWSTCKINYLTLQSKVKVTVTSSLYVTPFHKDSPCRVWFYLVILKSQPQTQGDGNSSHDHSKLKSSYTCMTKALSYRKKSWLFFVGN